MPATTGVGGDYLETIRLREDSVLFRGIADETDITTGYPTESTSGRHGTSGKWDRLPQTVVVDGDCYDACAGGRRPSADDGRSSGYTRK
jgi:hypothetical protein